MRAVRAILIILATLVALVLLALWQVPRFLDWNNYRNDISRLAAEVLDRPILIDGPITLQLLPQPELTAADVRIAGEPDEGTLSARELSVSLALAPLLTGRLDARELVLRGADIQIPWPLPQNFLPLRHPNWFAGLSARIEDGRLSIGNEQADIVSASLTVGGPTGGYQLAATTVVDGREWRIAARLGASGTGNASPLDMTLDGDGKLKGTEIAFTGQISPDGAGGRLTAKGADLAQLLPAPGVPFSAEGRLTIAGGLAVADDLALVIGDAPAHGAVSLRVTPSLRLDLALAASRLDLDAWLPVLLHGENLPCPVGLDLSAEAAQFSGGLVRHLRAAFELDTGKVEIRDASAILPGEATMRLSGRITHLSPGQPRFQGSVASAAPDLRATLQWLALPALGSLDTLPPSVLRSLNLSGQVSFERGRFAVNNLAGTLDGGHIGGSLALGFGARPMTVRADMRLDRLDLDAWLPLAQSAGGDFAKLPATLDADLRLQAAHAEWRGIAISDLVADGAAAGGRLAIRRLAGKALGAEVSLSGAVDASGHVSGARLALATQDATPLADRLPPPWRATPAFWRAPLKIEAEANGPPDALDLGVHLALADSALTLAAKLNLPGHGGSGTISLNNPAAPHVLQAAGFNGLETWLGNGPLHVQTHLDVAPDHISADAIDLVAGALRAGGHLSVDRSGEQPRLSGQVNADMVPLPHIDLRSGNPLPLDLLRGWQATIQVQAGKVLAGPGTAARTVLEDAAGTLLLDQGKLRLDNLAAKLAGGSLSGSASLDATPEPPVLALQGTLHDAAIDGPVADLPLDLVAGHADGDVTLHANGHSPAAMLATLDGTIHVSLRDGALVGFDLDALDKALGAAPAPGEGSLDTALTAALASGRTGFSRFAIAATASRGVLDIGGTTLSGSAGNAAFSGSIDLPGSALDLHAAIHPSLPDAPEIGLRITGPAAAPKHLPELADVTRWQAQHPHTP